MTKKDSNQKDMATLEAMLAALQVDHDKEVVLPPVMLTARGVPIGYAGSYVNIAGKEKQGKSTFVSAMIASAFAQDEVFHLKLIPAPGRPYLLYFDTEQTEMEVKETADQMRGFMLRDKMPAHLITYRLRIAKKDEIRPLIELAIEKNPLASIIVIDGLLDMVTNFNDEKQASDLLEWIRYITDTFKVLVIGVIHQAKSTGFEMGHLGSGSNRLASCVMQVEKDEDSGIMTLSGKRMRRRTFKEISIIHDGERFVHSEFDMSSIKKRRKDEGPGTYQDAEHRYALNTFMPEAGLMYDDLCKAAKERRGWTMVLAKKFVKHWMDYNYIIQKQDKKWYMNLDKKLFPIAKNF